MSKSKTGRKSPEEMSPEEREREHSRRLHEEVDAIKSAKDRRRKTEKDSPAPGDDRPTSTS